MEEVECLGSGASTQLSDFELGSASDSEKSSASDLGSSSTSSACETVSDSECIVEPPTFYEVIASTISNAANSLGFKLKSEQEVSIMEFIKG